MGCDTKGRLLDNVHEPIKPGSMGMVYELAHTSYKLYCPPPPIPPRKCIIVSSVPKSIVST